MPSLIPHLRDLVFQQNDWGVPADFVVAFLEMHGVSTSAPAESVKGWRTAQNHWEKVVALALDTDAVERYAQGKMAIQQAVVAAVQVLDVQRLRRGRCPICPVQVAPVSVMGGDVL
jgi:hypothetical protein